MRNVVGMLFIIPGGLLYAASWIVSIIVAFDEGGGWGWIFLFFGATGPLGGLIEGIVWGNWSALGLAAVALIFVGVGAAISGGD
ncbi:hypothetical protein FIL92_00620 [SAR202 cluster bacterium AD-812-D07_MRT_10900m]|nr:hypothetical protein [SAR202 cluster bacterium AD-812-D07_MRT_10900m]